MLERRITEISRVASNDSTASRLIAAVISAIASYKDAMANFKRLPILRLRCTDPQEVRDLTQRLDSLRRMSHDRLIVEIVVANRYLFRKYGKRIPPGGIYSDDPMHLFGSPNREAVADWAIKQDCRKEAR